MQNVAMVRSEILRAEHLADISVFDPKMLGFVDETGWQQRNSIRR